MALDDLSPGRATLAEKEVTALKEKVGAAAMAPPPPEQAEDAELVPSAAKDKEISGLLENVQRLQSSLAQVRDASAQRIRHLEEELEQKTEHISRLEARLDSQRDYDDLKRELLLLRGDNHHNNGLGEKERERDKGRPASPLAALPNRFLLNPGLPVEAFGSLLGDEIVSQWRRSLERSLLAASPQDSPSPPPPPGSRNSPEDQGDSCSDLHQHQHPSHPHGGNNGQNGGHPFRYESDSLIPKSDPMEAKLQEMLRHSMDKFGSQCLDTLQIARKVRELLSIHNIGQRLFAKYVLGLSQGTVSELLSKPKPWDKLTEKGRDSYRKMHAWAADEASVHLLKSLIPKKGGGGKDPGANFRAGDDPSDDRIAHILSEAGHALRSSATNSSSEHCDESGSKSPLHNNNNNTSSPSCPSPLSARERERRLRKYENDDIPQEQVARIYQEELAKLAGLRLPHMEDPRLHPSLLFPHLFGGSLLDREEVRMALDAYHRELAKLAGGAASFPPHFLPGAPLQPQQIPNGLPGAQDLSLPKRLLSVSPAEKGERGGDRGEGKGINKGDRREEEEDGGEGLLRHVGSAFSLVRPKVEGGGGGSGAASPLNSILPPTPTMGDNNDGPNASPLQRMASITNSLISQPTAPSVSSPNQRPLKAVLPPITQQQFDQYNNLNTEDIVRKVKEQLSQYSISQRLFGESVLGLSQGSVSDLLARPKPWHMLTQKGREPFIRMKMFLEDENAVHKLVASQYKIAPEKLMRTGGYAGNPTPTAQGKGPVPPLLKSLDPPKLEPPPPPLPPSPSLSSLQAEFMKKAQNNSPGLQGGHHRPSQHSHSHPAQAAQPSVYEMAALTQDLDTQLITTKIKEALLANNIGQKIFGEAVLGLSQGSVSELLSKPKPWHMLSIKGREPFIRMQLWLSDPLNVERLQHLKNERREANKRKRGLPHTANSPLDPYGSGTQGSSDNSNDSPNDSYSPGSSHAAPPNKKQRVLFSEEQKEALRLAFALDPYPNVAAIEFLARELALSSRTITNWFHNHRMRLKQQTSSPLVQESAQPFDPVQFRLLLHQRLLELHKDKFPMFSFLSGGAMGVGSGEEGGLDLTVSSNNPSRVHSDDDYFEEEELEEEDNEDNEQGSVASEDSNGSNSSRSRKRKSVPEKSISSRGGGGGGKGSGVGGGSSRRKPVAPQWLNPSWHENSEEEDDQVINGVCVFQQQKEEGAPSDEKGEEAEKGEELEGEELERGEDEVEGEEEEEGAHAKEGENGGD